MKRSEEARRADTNRLKLEIVIDQFLTEHELTDIEVLQALNSYAQTTLKYMLREERHPDDPDKPADIE